MRKIWYEDWVLIVKAINLWDFVRRKPLDKVWNLGIIEFPRAEVAKLADAHA